MEIEYGKNILSGNNIIKYPFNMKIKTYSDGMRIVGRKKNYEREHICDNPNEQNKVILLYRNPKDVMVSAYMYARYFRKSYNNNISSFIRSRTGVNQFTKFYIDWFKIAQNNKYVLVMVYEDRMKNNTEEIKKCFDFLKIQMSELSILKASKKCSFEETQKIEKEKTGRYGQGLLARSGKVGDYINYLSTDDIRYIELISNSVEEFI